MLLRKFSQTLRISLALMVATFSTGLLPTATSYAYHSPGHTGGAEGQTVCPDDSFTELLGGWDKTDNINALSWDIPEKLGFTVTDVCYKASNSVVYPDPITDPVVSTVWNRDGCTQVGPGCNYQNLSHVSVYYTKNIVALTPVTAGVVTYSDLCGTANDTYTVPTTANVTYSATAGTHSGAGAVTVTATANSGYVLTAPYTFSHTFTNETCPPQQVTAGVVTYSDLCGTANDTYTVPTTANVTYSVAAGTHAGSGTITVTAAANSGYALTAPYTFSYTFTNVACPPTPVTAGIVTYSDRCGTINDTYTVPTTANVSYSVSAGTHVGVGAVTVTATANSGYVLSAPYTFSYTFTNEACPDSENVTLCHATGSLTNPFVRITISPAGAFNGHLDDGSGGTHGDHQNGQDIIPPFVYKGVTYSQNWDTAGMASYRSNCSAPPTVTPAAAQFLNPTCENPSGRVVIIPTAHVTYKIGSTVVTGTTSYPAGTTVTVTAEVEEGYTLTGGVATSWSHTFTAVPTNCVLGDNDVCPNIEGSQTVVPAGMIQNTTTGECFTPGGRGGVTPAQVLGAATALPETLPSTGGADSPLAIIIASILAYGAAYFLQGRRLLGRKEALSA